MRKAWLLLFLASCTAPLARSPSAPSAESVDALKEKRCASLDTDHRTWGAVAKFGGVVAGAGGLTTVPISDDQKTLRLAIGLSALVVGGLAAAAVYVEQDAASSWSRECGR